MNHETLYTIPFLCHVCGQPTGDSITVSSRFGFSGNETKEQLGFVDIRCTPCENTHGNFKALTEEYRAAVKDDPAEAESFVARHRTRTQFKTQLAKQGVSLSDTIAQ